MADTTLSALTAASTLDGAEIYYSVQGGADRKVTGTQIKTWTATAPTIAGGSHTAITSLGIRSTGAAFDLTLASSEVLTAGRAVSINVADAARTLTISGNATISQDYSSSGTPQFASLNIGHASDTTVTRASAGDLAIEGNVVYRAGGTDVAIADGGTGASTATAAFDALAPTTTQGDIVIRGASGNIRLGTGSNGQVLTAGGAGANPSWTSLAGTGDVTAAANFGTDNVLVRSDGTGKGVQSTGISVADTTNDISGTGFIKPGTDDGGALGDATHNFSDLFLASGAVVNFNNGDVTVTHSANTLTIAGGITALAASSTVDGALIKKVGKETIFMPASAMTSRTTNGAASGTAEMATNKNMFKTLDFDTTTQEFAQFEVWFPKSWNLGTVTFQPIWSHAATATNFGVVWGLAGVARSDDDAGDVAFGTAVTSTDTGGTTNDIYLGPESAAITIAGTPAAGDSVQFQLNRTVADGSDTLGIDARLHGIRLFFTTNAADDT